MIGVNVKNQSGHSCAEIGITAVEGVVDFRARGGLRYATCGSLARQPARDR